MSGTLSLPTTGTFSGLTEQGYINAALAALGNASAGASAPTPASTGLASTAGLFWHDTANNLLKLRNQADTAWIAVGAVDETSGIFTPALNAANPTKPGGRLTLVSQTPVMTADETAKATIYYDSYEHGLVPLYTGNNSWIYWPIPSDEISLALDSNNAHTGYQASGSLFDVFAFNNSGTLALGTGPSWANATPGSCARGSGAGTTQLAMKNGIWTNAVSITLRFGSASGNTATVAANEATYLGTMYATAAGQTAMQFNPTPAPGGPNAIRGLWNAYNRVRAATTASDSTSLWTYSSTTIRPQDNSNNNRITFIDGLGLSPIDATLKASISGAGTTVFGVGINSMTTFSGPTSYALAQSTVVQTPISDLIGAPPILGLNYVQALEKGDGTNANTVYGSGGSTGIAGQSQALTLDTEY